MTESSGTTATLGAVAVSVDTSTKVKSNKTSSAGGRSLWQQATGGSVVQGALLCFVFANFIVLYALHFGHHPESWFSPSSATAAAPTTAPTTTTTNTNTTPSSAATVSFGSSQSGNFQAGSAVSLTQDSTSANGAMVLRNGAGTTAYLNRLTISKGDAFDYVNLAPMGVSKTAYTRNLISYRRTFTTNGTTKTESVVTSLDVDINTKAVTLTEPSSSDGNVVAGLNIRGLATLSDSLAIALVASSAFPYPSYAMPVQLKDSQPRLQQALVANITEQSISNFLGPLGPSTFVVAYYEPWSPSSAYYQRVKVGTVDSNGAITWSANQTFGQGNDGNFMTNFGKPQPVPAVPGTFVIPLFTTTWNSTMASKISGLCVTLSTFNATTNDVAPFSTPTCQSKFQPAFLIDSVMISDNVLAIAFYDKANNNAVTVATVSVSTTSKTLQFRSSYVCQEVGGAFEFGDKSYGFSPKPSIQALRLRHRVVVSFFNPSQGGKLAVKLLEIAPDTLAIRDVTPLLPVATPAFSMLLGAAGGVDGAVTNDVVVVGDDSVVAAYMGKRGTTVHQHFGLVEAYGSPIGLLGAGASASTSSHDVVLSGKITVNGAGFQTGQVYYATTAGTLMAANTSSASTLVYGADGNTVVTQDSKVGIALDASTLLLSKQVN
ncbi:TPA: hypothetical protein N0F65_004550 [Lagenidium giganteum]|uniref:Uncharacterized protein n=1 Tax=Lagenidium giganteum TaxID=4803 RepID=A0AAV2ZI75_9STRA|nr:TPA: hypothetical protein N0F65_004550 [Lagenidium giganteum]